MIGIAVLAVLAKLAQAALALERHDHSLGWLALALVPQAGDVAANGPCCAGGINIGLHGHGRFEDDFAFLKGLDAAGLLRPRLPAQGAAREPLASGREELPNLVEGQGEGGQHGDAIREAGRREETIQGKGRLHGCRKGASETCSGRRIMQAA